MLQLKLMLERSPGGHHLIQGAELYAETRINQIRRSRIEGKFMNKKHRTLTISQLSALLNVSKPTLRYWEKEFDGIFVPWRTAGGQRRYTAEHIEVVKQIRSLKGAGLSLSEIKSKLVIPPDNVEQGLSAWGTNADQVNLLAERVAAAVKFEVLRFFRK